MKAVQSGGTYEAEYRLRSKDGTYRWFRSRAVPIRDPEGKIVKWYGTCSDIHDSKLLEQSIRGNAAELEKMVDRRTDELRRLSVRLMTMQDQERRRLARNHQRKRGLKPAALWIVPSSKSARCLTFCIRRCWMK
jgi:IS5 family transposase